MVDEIGESGHGRIRLLDLRPLQAAAVDARLPVTSRESARACAGPAPGISGSFDGYRMRKVLRGRVHRHGRRIVGVECALRAPEPAQPRGLGVVEVRGDVQALQVARAVAHGVPLSLRLPVLSKGMTFVSHMGRLIHSPVDECMHGLPEPVIVAARESDSDGTPRRTAP